MKVIFLDHDGVICLSNNWGSRYKKQKKWGGRKLSMTNKEIPIEYRFDNFDKKAIKVLNEILKKTDAEIIISSDWRLDATLEELGDYYESQKIIKRPIGVTERFNHNEWLEKGLISEDFEWSRIEWNSQERYFEILKYLGDYPSITHWVAVDDLHIGRRVKNSFYGPFDRDWGLSNFVSTPVSWEGIKQCGIKEKILGFLDDKRISNING